MHYVIYDLEHHPPPMENSKVYIQHVKLWKLKNHKNVIKTAKRIFRVYSQGVITHW